MEIHKPKPWHGWREFLKEYLIIVIGVLTALGAEQAVETLHWREKVAATETALSANLRDIQFSAEERLTVRDCLERRIDQLEPRVRDAVGPLAPEPYWLRFPTEELGGPPYRAPIRPWDGRVWDAANADGTAYHMGRKTLNAYVSAYEEIAMIREENRREFDRISALGVLQRGVILSPADKTKLIERLEELRRDNNLIALQAGQVLATLKPLDLPPPMEKIGPANSATYRACHDLGLL